MIVSNTPTFPPETRPTEIIETDVVARMQYAYDLAVCGEQVVWSQIAPWLGKVPSIEEEQRVYIAPCNFGLDGTLRVQVMYSPNLFMSVQLYDDSDTMIGSETAESLNPMVTFSVPERDSEYYYFVIDTKALVQADSARAWWDRDPSTPPLGSLSYDQDIHYDGAPLGYYSVVTHSRLQRSSIETLKPAYTYIGTTTEPGPIYYPCPQGSTYRRHFFRARFSGESDSALLVYFAKQPPNDALEMQVVPIVSLQRYDFYASGDVFVVATAGETDIQVLEWAVMVTETPRVQHNLANYGVGADPHLVDWPLPDSFAPNRCVASSFFHAITSAGATLNCSFMPIQGVEIYRVTAWGVGQIDSVNFIEIEIDPPHAIVGAGPSFSGGILPPIDEIPVISDEFWSCNHVISLPSSYFARNLGMSSVQVMIDISFVSGSGHVYGVDISSER